MSSTDRSPSSLQASLDRARTAAVVGRDVPWLLRTTAERVPDRTFLAWEPFSGEPRTWSYAEFRTSVREVAAGLASHGVGFGDRVLIHLDNSPEFLLSWFACAEIGAVAVSTNTRSVARDMEYFADHARVVAAITSPRFARVVADSAPGLRVLGVTSTDAGEPPETDVEIDHVPFDDLAVAGGEPPVREVDPMADLGIQFTSGTTSRPKAVLWTHANPVWGAEVNVAHMRLRPGDVTMAFLPMFHTNAQSYSMMSTLWVGGTLVLQPRFSASRFWDVAVRHGVTWCSTIPFCVKAALSQPVPDDHSFRLWGIGARLPEIEERLGIATIGWWGMTETITHGIVTSVEQPGRRGTIGRAAPEFDVEVRRPDGTSIGPGERGRLYIRGVRGVQLFKCYDGNPEATAEAFDDDGWFDTGDVIAMDADGELVFSDRAKDMLKVGAENVAASEIEVVVMQSGLASECAVVGQRHAMLDEVPVVFVIPSDSAGDDVADRIREHCADHLADFKVPRSVHLVDALPRSTLEKVAKAELRDRLPLIET